MMPYEDYMARNARVPIAVWLYNRHMSQLPDQSPPVTSFNKHRDWMSRLLLFSFSLWSTPSSSQYVHRGTTLSLMDGRQVICIHMDVLLYGLGSEGFCKEHQTNQNLGIQCWCITLAINARHLCICKGRLSARGEKKYPFYVNILFAYRCFFCRRTMFTNVRLELMSTAVEINTGRRLKTRILVYLPCQQ